MKNRVEVHRPTVIKTVSFRANMPLEGKYQHIHIEAAADVPEGCSATEVLDDLKSWVGTELRRARHGEAVREVPPGRFRV